jgi:hypothetical protein
MPRFNTDRHYSLFVPLLIATLLAGCETTPTALEQNFGSSVRKMLEQQTAPPGYKGFGMDGEKSQVLLKSYRQDVAKPQNVEKSILQIKLGK